MNPRGVFEKKKGSNVWWVNYYENGRQHREKVGRKSTAIALYQKRKTEILEGKFFPQTRQGRISFEELAADALEYSRQHHVARGYKEDLLQVKTLLHWFKGYPAGSITPQQIEAKLAELADAGRSPATLNRYRSRLSLIYSVAIRNGKQSKNPLKNVKRRKENNERVRFLEEAEGRALRAIIRERYPNREAEFDLALNTGMRRGEQFQLRWQDVDLERGVITIPRSKNGEV